MIQSSRGPGNSFARYRENHVNEPCLQRGVSIPMDHVHDHLAEIVYHCCITRFPYGAVKTSTKIWQRIQCCSVYTTG